MRVFFPQNSYTTYNSTRKKKKKHHQQNESRRCPTNVCLGTWFYSTFTLFIPFNQGPPRVFPLSLRHVRLRHLAESCGLEIEGLEERERFPPGGVVKTWEFFERETLKQQRSFLKLHTTPRNAGIFWKLYTYVIFTDVVDVYIYICGCFFCTDILAQGNGTSRPQYD